MRRAFSLIELLVVISIIALLIAILLPALGAARRSAQDIQCLSNQQQIGRAQHVYAVENDGRLLVGSYGPYQFNYPIFDTAELKPTGIGILFSNGIMTDPQAYYCPRQSREIVQYNTATNPWQVAGSHTRSSYGLRPFDDEGNVIGWRNFAGKNEFQPTDDVDGSVVVDLPALEDYDPNDGLLADVFPYFQATDEHHQTGMNALRVDGSGRFINRALFDDAMASLIPGGFTRINNAALGGIWENTIKRGEPAP